MSGDGGTMPKTAGKPPKERSRGKRRRGGRPRDVRAVSAQSSKSGPILHRPQARGAPDRPTRRSEPATECQRLPGNPQKNGHGGSEGGAGGSVMRDPSSPGPAFRPRMGIGPRPGPAQTARQDDQGVLRAPGRVGSLRASLGMASGGRLGLDISRPRPRVSVPHASAGRLSFLGCWMGPEGALVASLGLCGRLCRPQSPTRVLRGTGKAPGGRQPPDKRDNCSSLAAYVQPQAGGRRHAE